MHAKSAMQTTGYHEQRVWHIALAMGKLLLAWTLTIFIVVTITITITITITLTITTATSLVLLRAPSPSWAGACSGQAVSGVLQHRAGGTEVGRTEPGIEHQSRGGGGGVQVVAGAGVVTVSAVWCVCLDWVVGERKRDAVMDTCLHDGCGTTRRRHICIAKMSSGRRHAAVILSLATITLLHCPCAHNMLPVTCCLRPATYRVVGT